MFVNFFLGYLWPISGLISCKVVVIPVYNVQYKISSSHNVDTRQSCLFVNMCTSSYSFLNASFSYERSDDVNGASIVLVLADVGVGFLINWKVQQHIHVQWLWTLKVDFHVESLVCNICWTFQSLQASFLHLCSFIAYLPLTNNVQEQYSQGAHKTTLCKDVAYG